MENLIYKTSLPAPQEFYNLFATTYWNDHYQLNSGQLFEALENSWYMISACSNKDLIGFGRIICDGVVHALILDLIIHPEFQKKGIGGQILTLLVEKCQQHQIRDIQLFCAKGYAGFYEKRGFKKREVDAPGMEYYITY